ncbi:hypothetical protein [Nonomuraea sp. GTA35]|uniref:hypothetical protein n=1 Tax=Nonomuraea sp. GTA35 TaxID=1676746 RepID=UPI0035C0E9D7
MQNTEEAITLAGMAEIVVLFPAHMTRYRVRPDITYLPVTDMGHLPYAMVWRSETDNEPIRAPRRRWRCLRGRA